VHDRLGGQRADPSDGVQGRPACARSGATALPPNHGFANVP
jgi:hypothetical protein